MIGILIVLKWVLLLLLSISGMVILITDPNNQSLGLWLYFGCFFIFAIDVARSFID